MLRRFRGVAAIVFPCCVVLATATAHGLTPAEINSLFQTIGKVGPNGAGSAAARQACAQLQPQGIEILPQVLEALDTPNNVAANWCRTLYEPLIARELERPQPQFPLAFLKEYAGSPQRQGKARRLVLSLLERLDPQFVAELIPRLLDDREFRQDAVAAALRSGEAAQKAGQLEPAMRAYEQAFAHAREADQITAAAAKLAGLGGKVSIVEHMGFLVDWYLIGPFDAPEYTGFDKVFPPETKIDLSAQYPGQEGKQIGWKRFQTPDSMGQMNLLSAIAATKEAVGYAYTEVLSNAPQTVQLRCGADDNCSVWLNGVKILGRNQWLNGTRLDRFVAPANLIRGRNTILVKICQGPQHKDPEVSNNWSLQLRLCDAEGGGVGVKTALPPILSEK